MVFPSAPTGIVYPGDPGVSRTLAPPGNRDFAPRIGLAYSPDGKTSVRAGFGVFYSAIPGETLGLISDNAPYGFTYTSPAPPLFTTPFVDAATGNVEGQRFPAQLAPLNVSASNPDPNIGFSQFEPISTIPGYKTTNTIPYTESYNLTLQRQVGTETLLSLGYVGNQAHHLLVLEAANPATPRCASASASPMKSRRARPPAGRLARAPFTLLPPGKPSTERAGLWARPSVASATKPPSATPITMPSKPACTTPVGLSNY